MFVNLFNPYTHQRKQAKLGYSWTTFFFGCLPALFRGHFLWFFIGLLVLLIFGLETIGIVPGLYGIVMGFFYNKIYVKHLIKKGFQPATQEDENLLLSKNIFF
ncbi:hypothetical protein [Fructobacillus ficulneus]|uniref:DUF2628 domain-containing protein n=1 Tax=Fructobacillus ficulneus TaxID=157463 RepID=A0A0K8MGZ7_9LACO|nr:hypothetical protein [Fructobacillus ficulneus]GAO99810.1 hypothetical protein FFIC_240850 [Fructobacillus ficulneus]